MKFEMTNMKGTPDSRASGDLGSPYFQENRDPDPQIPRKMETWGPILGGPHFPIKPVHTPTVCRLTSQCHPSTACQIRGGNFRCARLDSKPGQGHVSNSIFLREIKWARLTWLAGKLLNWSLTGLKKF